MYTLDEVRAWPATVDVADAGKALGVSRAHVYNSIRKGDFPVRVIKVGKRYRAITADLIALLEPAPVGAK